MGTLVVVRYASTVFTPAVLGLFLLTRRIAELIATFLQLGTSQMLRRYLPMTNDNKVQSFYMLAGLNVYFIAALAFAAILLSALDFWARLAFPDFSSARMLMFWTGMLAVSGGLDYLSSSSLLSQRRVLASNVVDCANSSIWLLLSIWLLADQTTVINLTLIQTIASCVLSSSIIFLFILTKLDSLSTATLAEYKSVLKESVAYSLPRAATPFLEIAIFLIGPWLLRNSPEDAGYLIIAFFVLRSGRLVVIPLSRMSSIFVTALLAKKDDATLRKGMRLLFGGLMYLGFLWLSFLYPWAYPLLKIWLGNVDLASSVLGFVNPLLLSLPPFVVYQGLKEQIEMVSKRPLNVYILLASICSMVGFSYVADIVLSPNASILYGYLLAFLVSAVLATRCIRYYLEPFRYFGFPRMLFVSIIVFSINKALAEWLSTEVAYLTVFGLACGFIVSATTIFVILYLKKPSPFVREIAVFALPARFFPI